MVMAHPSTVTSQVNNSTTPLSKRWVSQISLGTLVANLLGGYLIGIAIAFFSANPNLPPEWRLLVITGFLGGLTTFSTFSAEVTSLLQAGRLAWAGGAICVHVLGSLAMTLAGMWSMSMLQRM
ncbi:fluoride efflux transporter CrcB [Aeromonas veronii]